MIHSTAHDAQHSTAGLAYRQLLLFPLQLLQAGVNISVHIVRNIVAINNLGHDIIRPLRVTKSVVFAQVCTVNTCTTVGFLEHTQQRGISFLPRTQQWLIGIGTQATRDENNSFISASIPFRSFQGTSQVL
jgi:hypothetical protein